MWVLPDNKNLMALFPDNRKRWVLVSLLLKGQWPYLEVRRCNRTFPDARSNSTAIAGYREWEICPLVLQFLIIKKKGPFNLEP